MIYSWSQCIDCHDAGIVKYRYWNYTEMVMQKRMYLTADKSQENTLILLKVFEVFYITIKTAAEHKVFL